MSSKACSQHMQGVRAHSRWRWMTRSTPALNQMKTRYRSRVSRFFRTANRTLEVITVLTISTIQITTAKNSYINHNHLIKRTPRMSFQIWIGPLNRNSHRWGLLSSDCTPVTTMRALLRGSSKFTRRKVWKIVVPRYCRTRRSWDTVPCSLAITSRVLHLVVIHRQEGQRYRWRKSITGS